MRQRDREPTGGYPCPGTCSRNHGQRRQPIGQNQHVQLLSEIQSHCLKRALDRRRGIHLAGPNDVGANAASEANRTCWSALPARRPSSPGVAALSSDRSTTEGGQNRPSWQKRSRSPRPLPRPHRSGRDDHIGLHRARQDAEPAPVVDAAGWPGQIRPLGAPTPAMRRHTGERWGTFKGGPGDFHQLAVLAMATCPHQLIACRCSEQLSMKRRPARPCASRSHRRKCCPLCGPPCASSIRKPGRE